MQQIPAKKKTQAKAISAKINFEDAMQKQFESRKKGSPGTLKPETKAEAEAREKGESSEDKNVKTRTQVQQYEALKEKIRQNKSDKSGITKTMRALFGGK